MAELAGSGSDHLRGHSEAGAAISENLTGVGKSDSKLTHLAVGWRLQILPYRHLHRPAQDMVSHRTSHQRDRESMTIKTSSALILKVIHHHFCNILLVTQINSDQCGRGLDKSVNTRRWESLGPLWRLATKMTLE